MAPFKVRKADHPQFNATRIQEALLICVMTAILATGASTWTLSLVLEERIGAVQQDMKQHLEEDQRYRKSMDARWIKLFEDFYAPMRKKGKED